MVIQDLQLGEWNCCILLPPHPGTAYSERTQKRFFPSGDYDPSDFWWQHLYGTGVRSGKMRRQWLATEAKVGLVAVAPTKSMLSC